MPRIFGKRRVEDDISEYLLQMGDMIKMDNIQALDSDNEILDIIDAFFHDLTYLESQNKRYMATRYYSKVNDPDNRNLPIEARLHADIGAGRLDVDVPTNLTVQYPNTTPYFITPIKMWALELLISKTPARSRTINGRPSPV
jgi:hypothetical protein